MKLCHRLSLRLMIDEVFIRCDAWCWETRIMSPPAIVADVFWCVFETRCSSGQPLWLADVIFVDNAKSSGKKIDTTNERVVLLQPDIGVLCENTCAQPEAQKKTKTHPMCSVTLIIVLSHMSITSCVSRPAGWEGREGKSRDWESGTPRTTRATRWDTHSWRCLIRYPTKSLCDNF